MINILLYFRMKNTNMDQWQRAHFIDELSRHDCCVDVFNPNDYDSIEAIISQLTNRISAIRYDLFMTGHWDNEVDKSIVDIFKNKGIPTLLICYDNLIAPYNYKTICKYYDLVWLTSNMNQHMFLKWGCKDFLYQPYAANPFVFKPYKESELLETVFLGTPHSSRVNYINELLDRNIPVALYGSDNNTRIGNAVRKDKKKIIKTTFNYMTYGVGRKILLASVYQNIKGSAAIKKESSLLKIFPSVSQFEDIGKIYSRYALSLTSTPIRNTVVLKNPVFGMDLRTFEIAMSGGVMLCMESEEITSVFEKGKEIITFNSWDEMEDKAKYYLKESNESLRRQLRINIRKKAESEHTWFKRFKVIFDNLGIKGYV